MISINIQNAINEIKKNLEEVVRNAKFEGKTLENGLKAKESLIKSSKLINLIHEAIKKDLMDYGISSNRIFPRIGTTKGELRIAGFLKQKDQDVSVVPQTILREKRKISWGPLQYENIYDEYGQDYSEKSLIINIRSQLSSLAKNADTLFERTFAEAMNLHLIYPNMVLGDVYLIPVQEYDEAKMKKNEIAFHKHKTNILKYISFFSAISNRNDTSRDIHCYEKCALLIVDFNREVPKIYETTEELKKDGLIPENSTVNYNLISPDNYIEKICSMYNERFSCDIRDL